MTDSHTGYIVTLEDSISENNPNCERILEALRMIKGVISVEPIVENFDHIMAVMKAKNDLREQMREVLWKFD